MADFGSIVFISFPFTDLSATKLRPALVVSRDNERRVDVVLAFITSKSRTAAYPDLFPIEPSAANGLKVKSVVRFDKLVTLDKGLIVGALGAAEPEWLSAAQSTFYGFFGFAEANG
jgi:mRNA interferase MazF